MEKQTKTKQLKYYNLSEVEEFLEKYEAWYAGKGGAQTQDDSNPNDPPPPPPGPVKP